MADPAFVQGQPSTYGDGVTTRQVILNGVAANSWLIVCILQYDQVDRTYSVSDGSAYTGLTLKANTINQKVQIFYRGPVSSGDYTITATASGSSSFGIYGCEVSGVDAFDVESYYDHYGVNQNTHPCAQGDGLDTAADLATFVIACGVTTGGHDGTTSAATNYTKRSDDATYYGVTFVQSRQSATALTDDPATWSHAGTARGGLSVIAAFKGAAAGGPTFTPRIIMIS